MVAVVAGTRAGLTPAVTRAGLTPAVTRAGLTPAVTRAGLTPAAVIPTPGQAQNPIWRGLTTIRPTPPGPGIAMADWYEANSRSESSCARPVIRTGDLGMSWTMSFRSN